MSDPQQNDRRENKPIDLEAIRNQLANGRSKGAWRSLGELAETQEFQEHLHKEFPRETDWVKSLNRRGFLKLLAAPLALAGLAACQPQPTERIMPYTRAPEELLPGRPLYFSTAMEMDGYGLGLVVESHYGRPTKVEGNPDHPASLGATDIFAQASVLTLYDPDRAQVVSSGGQIRTWESFLSTLNTVMEGQRGRQGAGLRVLSGTVTSPTLAAQVRALLEQFPQAIWYQYDPVGRDNTRAGAQLAFEQVVETRFRFDRSEVILSLDDNFILQEPGRLPYLRAFAANRQPTEGQGEMNRLYVVESTYTPLGGFADHRLPVQAAQVEVFARALAARLGIQSEGELQLQDGWVEWLDALAEDLQAHTGASLILVGPQQVPAVHALGHAMNAALGNVGQTVFYTDPVEAFPVDQTANIVELANELDTGQVELLIVLDGNPVYTAPADLNFAERFQKAGLSVYLGLYQDETSALASWHIPAAHFLESWSDTRAFDGTTSIVQPLIEPLYGGKSPHELIAALLGEPESGSYDLVRGYWQSQFTGSGGAGDQGSEGVDAAPTDGSETGANSGATSTDQAGPTAAPGETESPGPSGGPAPGGTGGTPAAPAGATPAPGSTEVPGGTALPQATAAPGAAGEPGSPAEAASTDAGEQGQADPAFERFWRAALRQGILPDTAFPERQVSVQANLDLPTAGTETAPQGLEIIFAPDPSIWDGRFANNAWLQELPKPITKLTWDNAALVSPATALRLDLSNQDVVELSYRGRSLEAPVLILPGQPDDSITVHLGYGRARGGQVLVGTGFNAYALRTSDAPWFSYGLELRKTGRRYPLSITQEHHSMEGRDLVKTGTLEEFRENPRFAQETEHSLVKEGTPPPSLYPEYEYDSYAWGMSINQGACIGCNACVIACQAENNIPVVGKEQVENGREMHWLRIDTYFEGGLDNPASLFQPMLCMHCEKAPCEPVCPVEATVHSSEGLNEMVYNRCVGTRYCSNNCPYKVRRFNFFQYSNEESIPLKMLQNPDVTVRSRGVMEKCTYCIQRINAARIEAQVSGERIADGEVVTACQQACPTRAIVFGDINDENSFVRRVKEQPLNYDLLAELGTQPRTSYLAKLRNPNPRLVG